MTRRAPPVSLSRVPRPTLQSVLRRAHLRLAFVAVTMAAVSLIVVAVIALRAYAGNNLNLLARSLGYTVEAALVFGDRVAAEAIGMIAGDEDVAQVVVTDSKGQPFATWQLPAGSGIARLERVVADLALPGRDRAGGARRHRRRPRRRARPWPSVLRIPAWRRGRHSRLPGRQRDRCVYQLATPAAQHRFAVARAGGRRPRGARERAFAQRVGASIAELNQLGDDFNALLDEFEEWQNTLRDENASLEHKATHDALTGLPNRVQFESRLALALGEAGVTGQRVAILYLDCDRFKEINDCLGHDAGDAVLIGIASRLRTQVRAPGRRRRIRGHAAGRARRG